MSPSQNMETDKPTLHDILRVLVSPQFYGQYVERESLQPTNIAPFLTQLCREHEAELSTTTRAQLQLLGDLCGDLDFPTALCGQILLDSDGPCHSMNDVIAKYWAKWDTDPSMRKYAALIFEKRPSAVVSHLFRGFHSHLVQQPSARQDILSILESLDAELNLLRDPLSAENHAFASLPEERKDQILPFFTAIQQLCQIIMQPTDLPVLMKLGFWSVESVAYCPSATFKEVVSPYGIDADHAKKILSEARRVQSRAEQLVSSLVMGASSMALAKHEPAMFFASAVDAPAATTDQSAKPLDTPLQTNMSNWFGDLDDMGCPDCCSVTSTAAYFVDLLRFLKTTRATSKAQEWTALASSDQDARKPPNSLLAKLFVRRPELGDLLLSCRNTSERVSYIDLVNEILESAVAYLDNRDQIGSGLIIDSHNADDEQGFDHDMYISSSLPSNNQPPRDASNVNHNVYDQVIAKAVYPSSVFPYSHAIHALREYLQGNEIRMEDVIHTFQPFKKLDEVNDEHVREAVARSCAAAILNLTEGDFVALAEEALYPLGAARTATGDENLSKEDYQAQAGLKASWHYWGYLDEDEEEGDGAERMLQSEEEWRDSGDGPQLGLTFLKEQLLPRLGESYQTLVQLLGTRFLANSLVIVPFSATSEPLSTAQRQLATELGEFRLCSSGGKRLNAFALQRLEQIVRLWRRCRQEHNAGGKSAAGKTVAWTLDEVDDSLCAFGENPPAASSDPGSIGRDLKTISPRTIKQMAAVAEIARRAPGQMSPGRIIALFDKSASYLQNLPIAKAIAFGARHGAEPPNLSSRYLSLLLASLELAYADYAQIQADEQIPCDETITMETIFLFHRLSTLAKLLGVTYARMSTLLAFLQEGCGSSDLARPEGLLGMLTWWQNLVSDGWKAESILSTFPKTHSGDSNASSTACTFLSRAIPSLTAMPPRPQSASGANGTSALIGDSLTAAVQSLVTDMTLDMAKVLLSQPAETFTLLSGSTRGTVQQILFSVLEYIYSSRAAEPGEHGNGDFMVFAESCTITVKCTVPKASRLPISLRFGPDHTCSLTSTAAQDGAAPAESSSIQVEGKLSVSVPQDGTGLLPIISVSWPPECSDVRFAFTTDGEPASHQADVALQKPPLYIPRELMAIVEAEVSKLSLQGSLLRQYRLGHQEVQMLAPVLLRPSQQGMDALHRLERYSSIRKVLSRPGMEADFASATAWFCSVTDPSVTIRTAAARFSKSCIPSPSLVESLLLENLGGRHSDEIINKSQPGAALRLEILHAIAQQVKMLSSIGLKQDSVSHLFAVARAGSAASPSTGHAAGSASSHVVLTNHLRASLVARGASQSLGSTQDRLRDGRRKALVQYLIQHPAMKACGVADEGSLFEFFLIDVQMSSGLETTRIQQAISTVQLFVHRCLLGSEQGVEARLISRDRWSWMQRYTTWEANRRVFLYPESYADPTLRDGKTDIFRAVVEEAAMQNTLDEGVVQKIIRNYIYAADEVANLRVEAVYYDPEVSAVAAAQAPLQGEGVYHLFARTRNAPYAHYYRTMEHTKRGQSIPSPVWSPWAKMPFNISGHEVDTAGKPLDRSGTYIIPVVWRKRLLVFMPKLSIRTTTTNKNGGKSTMTTKEKSTTVEVANPVQLSIDIKLAWTEQVDAVFASPKQGQVTVNVPSDAAGSLPPFESFYFEAKPSRESVSILLYQNQQLENADGASTHTCLGEFVLYGDHLMFHDAKKTKGISSSLSKETFLSTTFGSLTRSSDLPLAPALLSTRPSNSKVDVADWPKLPVPDIGTGEMCTSLTWTLNSRSGHRVAVAVDATLASASQACQPWFLLCSTSTSMPLYNTLADGLRNALASDPGVNAIYRIMDQSVVSKDGKFAGSQAVDHGLAFGNSPMLAQCREDATPCAIYNWEAGFHNIAFLMERLISLQQVDRAVELAHLVFDPTGSSLPMGAGDGDGDEWRPVWRFPPFRDPATRSHGTVSSILSKLQASSGSEDTMDTRIRSWRLSPFQPHAVARNRPLAYMKRFVMKYIEALVASGDNLFRQNSLELVPLAVQKYTEALHVFGPPPQTVTGLNQKKTFKSYNQLAKQIDDFSNASVLVQLTQPYYVPVGDRRRHQAGTDAPAEDDTVQGGPQTTYFGVQANKEFVKLRELIEDRLFKIRNSLDINGNPRTLSIWDPPINPNDLVKAVAAAGTSVLGGGGSSGGPGSTAPGYDGQVLPRKRFGYLLAKALELCGELRNCSNMLLAAMEKKDGEALQLLRGKQDVGLQRIIGEMKEQQKKEAELGLDHLQQIRQSHVHRMQHYAALTGDTATVAIPSPGDEFTPIEQNIPLPADKNLRLTSDEVLELDFADQASRHNTAAADQDWWASHLFLLPMPSLNMQFMGLGVTQPLPNVGQGFQIEASIKRSLALNASEESARSGRIAQWTRQLQERRLQLNLAGLEITAVDKQIAVQRARIAALDADLRAQMQSTDAAAQTLDFLSTKLTNQQLYSSLEAASRASLYKTYLVAFELARKVESVYLFEQRTPNSGNSNNSFISPSGYWDSSHHGLLAGEQLWMALKQLELAYMAKDEGRPPLYMTKNISLRQLKPGALISLRELGDAMFELPELLFDLDYPGHYFRRIHSVSFSVQCIVGPYTSVNCTASLVDHKYRTSSIASPATGYAEKTTTSSSSSSSSDERFAGDKVKLPITSVAISSGQNDAGIFDLSFSAAGEEYQPFEGAGVISTWRLRLPSVLKQFSYDSISDVVMHMRYSALDGGEMLREAASKSALERIKKPSSSALSIMVDLRQDSPDALFALTRSFSSGTRTAVVGGSSSKKDVVVMPMGSISDRLPYFARTAAGVNITDIVLYAAPGGPGAGLEQIRKWKFSVCPRKTTQEPAPGGQTDEDVVQLGYADTVGDMFKFTIGAAKAVEASIQNEPSSTGGVVLGGNLDLVREGAWALHVEGLGGQDGHSVGLSNVILIVDYVLL